MSPNDLAVVLQRNKCTRDWRNQSRHFFEEEIKGSGGRALTNCSLVYYSPCDPVRVANPLQIQPCGIASC